MLARTHTHGEMKVAACLPRVCHVICHDIKVLCRGEMLYGSHEQTQHHQLLDPECAALAAGGGARAAAPPWRVASPSAGQGAHAGLAMPWLCQVTAQTWLYQMLMRLR